MGQFMSNDPKTVFVSGFYQFFIIIIKNHYVSCCINAQCAPVCKIMLSHLRAILLVEIEVDKRLLIPCLHNYRGVTTKRYQDVIVLLQTTLKAIVAKSCMPRQIFVCFSRTRSAFHKVEVPLARKKVSFARQRKSNF